VDATETLLSQETWVGRPVERFEDDALLRGAGRFLDDLDPAPGAHHAAVLRSPHAHARIVRLDPSAALRIPGVTGVLTGADVVELSRPFPAACPTEVPCYAAAAEVARHVGEPVAVAVARDRYVAEDALDAIEVEYEPLEPLMDPHAAAAAGAPSLVSDRRFAYGDPDAAFARAALVVRERFAFPRWTGAPMECAGVVARWDHGDDSLTAWTNFQGPFTLHSVAAAALGLTGARLRLITPPDSGGSFGVKAAVYAAVVLMGLASRRLGVPVRWIEDRRESLAAGGASTQRTTDIEAAFTADGELIGLRLDVVEDVGAYVRAPEPATLYRMHGALSGAYRVRDVAVRNRVVLTNRAPTTLNRGFGGPQHYLPIEGAMAIAAHRLGLGPIELARRNLIGSDEFPYTTPSGGVYASGDYEGCLDDALELFGYDRRRAERDAARAEGRLVGIGIACVVEPSISNMGYVTLVEPAEERAQGLPKSGNAEGASVAINPNGGVTVRMSTTPQGQGHATVARQVAADALGITPQEVRVVTEMDTAVSPWTVSSGAYSSRFSGVGAGAVLRAAEQVAAKLRILAAAQLGCDPDAVVLAEGRAAVAGDPEASVSLRRLVGAAHWNPHGLPEGLEPGLHATAFCAAEQLPPPDGEDHIVASGENGFVVDLAMVEVDRDTGRVRVIDYASVHDAGRLLNPRLAAGQVQGGFAHGVGAALQERIEYGADGALLTPTLKEYLLATPLDLPTPRTGHRETPSPLTPLGAKGLGEGTTMSAPCALQNAVTDALGADHPVGLPLTPSRIWERIA
jgi:2-furoyl-CoA dehydrogenase large subunit